MDFRQKTAYSLNQKPGERVLQPLHLFTDGAYFAQHHLGGWGVAIYDQNQQLIHQLNGVEAADSSLQMELKAVIQALEWCQNRPKNTQIALYTDAKIVLEGLFEKVPIWHKNHWHGANGNSVVFAELWQKLFDLANQPNITFYWIKGHRRHPQNQLADQLARQTILNLKSPQRCFSISAP
ncbi:MAG: ribonuclease HI [Thiotrichales bacterium]|nr:ribonuclease HI [Thiotrichales bacterium]